MVEFQINLDKTLATVEKFLDVAGYIPVVSTFSGAFRIKYGKVETVASVGLSAVSALYAVCKQDQAERARGLDRAVEVLTYSIHGIANVFRGAIEMVPFLSLFTCLPYDLLKARFTYPRENANPASVVV